MPKKLLFIINPHSGRGAIKHSFVDIADTFTRAGYAVEVYTTQRQFDATETAYRRGGDYDVVVCSGGDGTVNEVVSGLALLDDAPPLGLIPAGTTNDFCHTLGIPTDPKLAAQLVVDGPRRRCDTGLFEGRRFVYAAAFGLFTDVTYETPQDLKKRLGSLAYGLSAVKSLTKYEPHYIRLEHDTGVIEDEFMLGMISNTVSIAGFRKVFDSVAHLDDGLLEVTLVKMPIDLPELQKTIGVLTALDHVDDSLEFITMVSTSRARLTSAAPIGWTLDGEDGGLHTVCNIEVSPKSLHIICGDTAAVG